MITGVAFIPMPPLLDPRVASGAAHELDGLRDAVEDAVKRASHSASIVVLLAPAGGEQLARWVIEEYLGSPAPAVVEIVVPHPTTNQDRDDAVAQIRQACADSQAALIVLGDGTARRSIKAPGYLDKRATAFDDSLARILADADPEGLAALDLDLARGLMVAGADTWPIVGTLISPGEYVGELLAFHDPYGVAYFVAVWKPGIPNDTTAGVLAPVPHA